MAAPAPIRDIDELLRVLEAGAALDDGEPVDLLTHALQCAGHLQAAHPEDPELVAAGLVHDVGSVLAPGHPEDHAAFGAAAIGGLLGARVARLVAGHAEVKRYLVSTDPAYRNRLSPRSVTTLTHQGGVMGPRQVDEFTRDAGPDLGVLVALRHADDAAKVPGAPVTPLAAWAPLLSRVRSGAGAG